MPESAAGFALPLALLLSGLVHLLPALGAVSARRLQQLYGVAPEDGVLLVLLRHRALLFGLLGTGLLIAAFVPQVQLAAALAGLLSMLSFVALAAAAQWPAPLRRIWQADLTLGGLLLLALVLHLAGLA